MCATIAVIPSITPNSPNIPDKIMIGKRRIRIDMPVAYLGIKNEATPVMATTITIGDETNPAAVAACPITRAPTILTAAQLVLAISHLLHAAPQK